MLVNNTEGQGSPAASIGAYITLFKERKRLKALKAQQRWNKTRRPSTPRVTAVFRRHYDDYYGDYRPYNYFY